MRMKNTCWRFLKTRMIFLLSAIVAIDFVTPVVVGESTAVVNTVSGPVRGKIVTTFNSVKYASFLGIRYGKAPVGYLRFKAPVAADPWTEIFDATVEGEHCIQYNESITAVTGSEDCLFINVHTPAVDLSETPKNLKSVIFWLYGGGFLTGTSSSELERPDRFVHEDIVFVSLNYRSGLFGYLALGIANATGNAGLKDLVLGLKWVKANIERFGGNPNNVTIMGISSGGVMIDYLLLSDSAAGLFHGSVAMSGTMMESAAFHTPAKAQFQAGKLADMMGITWTDREGLLRAFYNAPADEIVKTTHQIAVAVGPFRPTIEDESVATDVFLSRCPMDKLTSGNFSKFPHMLGYTDYETVSHICGIVNTRDMLDECVNAGQELNLMLPQSIISAYDALHSSMDFNETLNYPELRKFINDTSDLLYIAPIHEMQQILAANNDNPVYYYHISYSVPGPHYITPNNTLHGAGHGDELPFIFYVPAINYSKNAVANLTAYRIGKMLSNFAKYGNPKPGWLDDDLLNVTWPDSGPSGFSLNIGSELTVDSNQISTFAKSWENCSWPRLRAAKGCPYAQPNSSECNKGVSGGQRITPDTELLPFTLIVLWILMIYVRA